MVIHTDRLTYIQWNRKIDDYLSVKAALSPKELKEKEAELEEGVPLASFLKFRSSENHDLFGDWTVPDCYRGLRITLAGKECFFWFDGPIMMIRALNALSDACGDDLLKVLDRFTAPGGNVGHDFLRYDGWKKACLTYGHDWIDCQTKERLDESLFLLCNPPKPTYLGDPTWYKENRHKFPYPIVNLEQWIQSQQEKQPSSRYVTYAESLRTDDVNVRYDQTSYELLLESLAEAKEHLQDPVFIKYLEWTDYEPCLWLPLLDHIPAKDFPRIEQPLKKRMKFQYEKDEGRHLTIRFIVDSHIWSEEDEWESQAVLGGTKYDVVILDNSDDRELLVLLPDFKRARIDRDDIETSEHIVRPEPHMNVCHEVFMEWPETTGTAP